MSAWPVVVALAIVAFAVLAFVLRAPRVAWSAIGAALLFGLAGYARQGRPDLPGSPHPALARSFGDPAATIALRHALAGAGAAPDANLIVIADALARHGEFGDAAGVLLGAVEKQPRDAQAWIALGNALVGHADGTLTPAGRYAYRQALAIDPAGPGAPFFLGLALAQSGRFVEARRWWVQAIGALPADAPSRPELVDKLRRLDVLIAAQAQEPSARQGMPDTR